MFEIRFNEIDTVFERYNANTGKWEVRAPQELYHIDKDLTFTIDSVDEFMRIQDVLARGSSDDGVIITRQFTPGVFVFDGQKNQRIEGIDGHNGTIITIGAPMIGPVPTIPRYTAEGQLVDEDGNEISSVDILATGSDAASRASDLAANEALLRQRYATIIEYKNGNGIQLKGKNGGIYSRLVFINKGNGKYGLITGDGGRITGDGANIYLDNMYFLGANSTNVSTHYGGSIFSDEGGEGPVVALGAAGSGFQSQYGGGMLYMESAGSFGNAKFGVFSKNGGVAYV